MPKISTFVSSKNTPGSHMIVWSLIFIVYIQTLLIALQYKQCCSVCGYIIFLGINQFGMLSFLVSAESNILD